MNTQYGPGNPAGWLGAPANGWAAPAVPAVAPGQPPAAPGLYGSALLMMPPGLGRDALAAALTHVGFQVLAFDSPLEVAGHLFGLRPRVVLVDALHGAFMGTQAAAWLRLAGLNTPVVVMGNTQADFVDHMQRSGVAHVVPYPADVMVFSRQVVDAANAAPASPGQTPPVAWR